jgi:hypothetical protein
MDEFRGMAHDPNNNVYLCGSTESANFPVTQGAFQTSKAGYSDAVVVKLSSNGSRIWATFCGGGMNDPAYGIAAEAGGNVIIYGTTGSADYPVCNALQATMHGPGDRFATKFNSTASALIWSTYYGGSLGDGGGGAISLDGIGNVAFAGYTKSADFPTYNPVQASNSGGYDVFIVQLNSNGQFQKGDTRESAAPVLLSLEQNYPNPFPATGGSSRSVGNPTTTIRYSITEDATVLLRVFDINGRLVAELVNGAKEAGRHKVDFNAGELPSGMYIYRLEANGQILTGRMALLK